MTPTPDYAAQLAEWERATLRALDKRLGFEDHCTHTAVSTACDTCAHEAVRRYPLPSKPLPPKVPRVVTLSTGWQVRTMDGQKIQIRTSHHDTFFTNIWTIADCALIASLARRPFEGDEVPALTAEWCAAHWTGNDTGMMQSLAGRSVLHAFARAVLTTFGGK